MSNPHDSGLPDHLAEVAETVRRFGPEPSPLQLDSIKRRVLMSSARSNSRKGTSMKTKLVTLLLAAGLAVTGGTAGVIAAGDGPEKKNAAKSEYKDGKCNSGNGNGSDEISFVEGAHCFGGDPGNSFKAGNKGGDEQPTSGGVDNPGGNNVP